MRGNHSIWHLRFAVGSIGDVLQTEVKLRTELKTLQAQTGSASMYAVCGAHTQHNCFMSCVAHYKERIQFYQLKQTKIALEGLLPEAALRLADPMISNSKRQKLTTQLAKIHAKIDQYQTRMLAFEGTLP